MNATIRLYADVQPGFSGLPHSTYALESPFYDLADFMVPTSILNDLLFRRYFVIYFSVLYDDQLREMAFLAYANSDGSDHPAHTRRKI